MIKPIKDLGQNFLRNQIAISKIVELLRVTENDEIFEIGPGEGVLTFEILKSEKNFQLTSIDVDSRVEELLVKIEDPRFKFVLGDILKQSKISENNNYKIIGAIPYNITSPILHLVVNQENLPKKVVLVMQKEVAEKISDSKKGSYLSNLLKYFFEIHYEFTISRNDFYPVPKVDSGVVTLTLKNQFENIDKNKFSSFLHKVFRSPRKKINKVFERKFLEEINIDENKRPEELTLDEIISLYKNSGN